MESALQKGVAAARAKNKKAAIQYLKQALKEDPRNVNAWLWLSSVLDVPEQREFCYKKILELDPKNKHALKGLGITPKPTPPTPTPTPTPAPAPQPSPAPKQRVPQTNHPPKVQKNAGDGSFIGKIGKIILWIIALLIGGITAFSLITSTASSNEHAIGMTVFYCVMVPWALSGYYGAWLLLKKGHGSSLLWITLLLGGIPLLVPMFVGPFMFILGRLVKDKHAPADAYIVCPSCSQPTSMSSAFCSNCGNQIQRKKR